MTTMRKTALLLATTGAILWGAAGVRAVALLRAVAAAPPAGDYSCFKSIMEYSPVPGPGGPMMFLKYIPSVVGTLKLESRATYHAFKGAGRYAYNARTGRFSFLSGPLKGWPAVYEVSGGTPMVRLAAVKDGSVGPNTRTGEHLCRWRGDKKFADTAAPKGVGRGAATTTVAGNPGFRGTLTFKQEWGSGAAIVDVDLATGKTVSRFEGRDPQRGASGETVFVNRLGALVIAGKNGVVAATIPVGGQDAPAQPALSPDGSKVAYYLAGGLSTNRRVVVVTRAGKRVAEFPAVTQPAWTPDGRLVVAGALGFEGDKPAILLSDPGLTTLKRIDPNLDDAREPSVSPDGRRIALVYQGHFWTMNRDGTGLKQVTSSSGGEVRPAWSPDGRSLAGADREYGTVFVVRLSDGKIRPVKNADGTAMQSSGRITWR